MDWSYTGILNKLNSLMSEDPDVGNSLFDSLLQGVTRALAYILSRKVILGQLYLRENSLRLAQNDSSVIEKAYNAGYVPRRFTASIGSAIVNGTDVFQLGTFSYLGETTVIPKRTLCQNTQGIICYTSDDVRVLRNTIFRTYNVPLGTSPVDLGGGLVGITKTAHGQVGGETLTIVGSNLYDGTYILDNSTSVNQLVFRREFINDTFRGNEIFYGNFPQVTIRQGQPVDRIYTAQGLVDEEIEIINSRIAEDDFEVFIVNNAIDLEIVSNVTLLKGNIQSEAFLKNEPNNYYAEIRNFPDYTGVTLRFGNGRNTRKLSNGEVVWVRYILTDGKDGEIFNRSSVNQFAETILDALGNPVTFSIRNVTPVIGGLPRESIESIKFNTRAAESANERATALPDWDALASSLPGVGRIRSWTLASLGLTTSSSLSPNQVFLAGVDTQGNPLSQQQQNIITNDFLIDKKSSTEIISWVFLGRLYTRFDVEAQVTNVPFSDVIEDISNELLSAIFILNPNQNFGKSLPYSLYNAIIQNLDSVIEHDTVGWYVEKTNDFEKSAYKLLASLTSVEESDLEDQILLSNNQLELWIRLKVSGVWSAPVRIGLADNTVIDDDPLSPFTLSNTSISYSSCTISYRIDEIFADPASFGIPDPQEDDQDGYVVFIHYRTEDGNGGKDRSLRLSQEGQYLTYEPLFLNFEGEYQ